MKMVEYFKKYHRQSSLDSASDLSSHLLSYLLIDEVLILSQLSGRGRGKKILQIGCTERSFSRVLIDEGHDVVGLEISPVAAELGLKQGIEVRLANLEEQLPFDSESFDGIQIQGIIEHLFDTKVFFLECHRILKKDGFLVFMVPNLNSIENRIQILKGEYLSNLGAYPEDHYGQNIRIFNESKLRELCLQTGFDIEAIYGVFWSKFNQNRNQSKFLEYSTQWISRKFSAFSKNLVVQARKKSV